MPNEPDEIGAPELIRGRFHPDLHPVLRSLHREPLCRAYGLPFTEDGEEYEHCCGRPAGHTGRHLDWEWVDKGQAIHVWNDEERTDDYR